MEFEVTVDRLVDLTRADARAASRVRLEDLVRPRVSADASDVPQKVAGQVYRERLNGLLVPSILDPNGEREGWFNLVLYSANMVRTFIREIKIVEIDLPLR